MNSWAPLLAAVPPDAPGPMPLQPYRLAVGLMLAFLLGGGALAILLAVEQLAAKVAFG